MSVIERIEIQKMLRKQDAMGGGAFFDHIGFS